MMNTPAGWFPDPENPAQIRYWDGQQWTEHCAPAGKKPPTIARQGTQQPQQQATDAGTARQDIDSAKARMTSKIGSGREIKKLTGHLTEGELVEYMTSGAYGAGRGLVVLTNRRLIFLKEGILAAKSEDFPISKISSIQWSSGMVMGTVTIFASGNKAEINHVNKGDGKAIVDRVRSRISAAPDGVSSQPAQVVAGAGDDVIAKIQKLGDLRDAGILTPEEFDAKKTELLGRL